MSCDAKSVAVEGSVTGSYWSLLTLKGCGKTEFVIRICDADACGYVAQTEAERRFAHDSGCAEAKLRRHFTYPDTLRLGGCGLLWVFEATPSGWSVADQGEDAYGFFKDT